MFKVEGQGTIYKKDVKANRNGNYWLRLAIRVPKENGYNTYNASFNTDSRMEMENYNIGDHVYIQGNWDILRMKQADGTPIYYNTIKINDMKKVSEEQNNG